MSSSFPLHAPVGERLPWPVPQRLLLLTVGLLLLGSMSWSVTFDLWRQLDWMVYRGLQQLLVSVPALQPCFAILNAHPLGNLLMDAAFLAVGLPWLLLSGSRREAAQRLGLASYYVVVWKITMTVVNRWFYGDFLQWQSQSPSLIEAPLVNLQHQAPSLSVKVFAIGTFPSDHAMQLLLLALVMTTLCRPWHRLMVPVCLFFCLPRLMSGAHWASDIAAGGLGIALVGLVFWFGTPLSTWGMRAFGGFWSLLLGASRDPATQQSS
jgi:membrane-associated phospholipid phosphatase